MVWRHLTFSGRLSVLSFCFCKHETFSLLLFLNIPHLRPAFCLLYSFVVEVADEPFRNLDMYAYGLFLPLVLLITIDLNWAYIFVRNFYGFVVLVISYLYRFFYCVFDERMIVEKFMFYEIFCAWQLILCMQKSGIDKLFVFYMLIHVQWICLGYGFWHSWNLWIWWFLTNVRIKFLERNIHEWERMP